MMRKFYVILSFLFSVFFFSQEFKWGMTGNVHSSSIEGIHDFSRGRIAPSLGFFAEIPLETFQRSIYSPLRYYIFPVLEYSMEGEKTILEQGRQYYRNDFVALAFMVNSIFIEVFLKIFTLWWGLELHIMFQKKEQVLPMMKLDISI
jgi:hypothetical protein